MEGRGDLEALHRTGLLLALGGVDRLLELFDLGLEIHLLEEVADGLCAHAAAEVLAPAERRAEALLQLAEDGLVVDDVLDLHLLEDPPDLFHPLDGVVDVGLGVGDLGVERLLHFLQRLRALGVVELLRVREAEVLGPQLVLAVPALLRVLAFEPRGAAGERLGQLLGALLALGAQAVQDLVDLLFELGHVLRARFLVDVRDDRGGEVEDLLELLRSHVDQVADPRRERP